MFCNSPGGWLSSASGVLRISQRPDLDQLQPLRKSKTLSGWNLRLGAIFKEISENVLWPELFNYPRERNMCFCVKYSSANNESLESHFSHCETGLTPVAPYSYNSIRFADRLQDIGTVWHSNLDWVVGSLVSACTIRVEMFPQPPLAVMGGCLAAVEFSSSGRECTVYTGAAASLPHQHAQHISLTVYTGKSGSRAKAFSGSELAVHIASHVPCSLWSTRNTH